MSHTTRITGLELRSVTAIEAAVGKLKAGGVDVELLRNAHPRMYFGSQNDQLGLCDLVLKVNRAKYDLGMKLNNETGEYELFFDEYMNSIRDQIGMKAIPKTATADQARIAHVRDFVLNYNKSLVEEQAASQGIFDMSTSVNDKGHTVMEMQVGIFG